MPVRRENAGQLVVGVVIFGVILVVLWFALRYVIDALAPLLQAPR